MKFPFFWYLAHMRLLTPAPARLSLCSGFAQAYSPLLKLSTIFGTLHYNILNYFNCNQINLELVLHKIRSYLKQTELAPSRSPSPQWPHQYHLALKISPNLKRPTLRLVLTYLGAGHNATESVHRYQLSI